MAVTAVDEGVIRRARTVEGWGVQGLVDAVAAIGLPRRESPTEPLLDKPIDSKSWSGVLRLLARERVTGLAVEGVRSDVLPVTDEQLDQLAELHEAALAQHVCIERALLHAQEVLAGADVNIRVLKGAAVAHLDYADPGLRSFGDVDLLVRSDQFDLAAATLTANDYRRLVPEFRPGFDRRFGKGAMFVAPDGNELDLHRTLTLGPFGLLIDLDELWGPPASFPLAGEELLALDATLRLVHSCIHAALGRHLARLVPLRDIGQLLANGSASVEGALATAQRWQASVVVARALTEADERLFGESALRSHPMVRWARAYRSTAREQRAFAAYKGKSTYGRLALASLPAIHGVRNRTSFLRYLLMPQRDALSGRGRRGYTAWWRRAVAGLTRRTGR